MVLKSKKNHKIINIQKYPKLPRKLPTFLTVFF